MLPSSANGGTTEDGENPLTQYARASVTEELWQSIAQNLGLKHATENSSTITDREKKIPEISGVIDPQQYKNLAPKAENTQQTLSESMLAVVDFNMQPEDVQQVWFHPKASRKAAEDLLLGKPEGTFLLRPSSQRGSYALSYVGADGKVQHDLVYGLCPGFSLHPKPEPENKFWSLATLVAQCKFLSAPLLNSDAEGASILSRNLTRSGVEVVSRVLEQLLLNAPNLHELNWQLAILENHQVVPDAQPHLQMARAGPATAPPLERRTFVRYANEEYVAPDLLPLRDSTAKIVLDALRHNDSVRVLNVNGHKGIMRLNFTHNFTDLEAQYLAAALRVNTTLTRVDLSVNRIGDEGAIYLAQALRTNRTLKVLNLSHNFIRADGLFAIAEALKGNTCMQEIDVSSQMTQRAGTPVLAANDYERALVTLIESSLKRRRELLDPQALLCFHGYRTRAQVEALLAGAPPLACMLYLNPCIANVVCRAMKSADGATIEHKLIYPVTGAYSLRRDPSLSPLPSLLLCCAWFLANPGLAVNKASLPPDVADRVAACAIHNTLWGIRDIPARDRGGAALPSVPTVSLLAQAIPRAARPLNRKLLELT